MKLSKLALVGFLLITCSSAYSGQSVPDELAKAIANPFDDAALDGYLATLPFDGTYYVLEGDRLATREEVLRYLIGLGEAATDVSGNPELLLALYKGVPSYWQSRDARTLTYAIDRNSFANEEEVRAVSNDLTSAANAWESACPECGIRFVHEAKYDDNPSHNDVLFIVRKVGGGQYIAAAFFPYYAPARRLLNIDGSFFTTQFDRVGVLRHELGHILGYRHEHIVGIPGCRFEDNQWMPLTPYDPHSVMHYFCGGGGTMTLDLTALDKAGHRTVYGK